MSEYVKIKRSKNLRFRLISLMYLIFIVLAMMQIPVAWLKIASPIRTYFSKSSVVSQDSSFNRLQNEIKSIENDFKQFIQYQNLEAGSPILNSYAKTDNYFLNLGNGEKVFAVLNQLKALVKEEKEKQIFDNLFEQDLANGLKEGSAQTWVTYKFKHTPANLALTQLAEMQLRISLLNEGKLNANNDFTEPTLSLMTRYANMRVGDEANFQVKGDTLQEIFISRDQNPSNDYTLYPNGFIFKPQFAGTYTLSVRGLNKTETMAIEVLAAGFPTKNALPFRICYKGVSYTQRIPFEQSKLTLTCNADAQASLQRGLIQFTPDKEGWCTLLVKSAEGVLFHDSAYVKPLPDPIFLVQDVPNLQCSKKRLKQLNGLNLLAFHPSFKEGNAYRILSFKVRSIGKATKVENVQGTSYSPAAEDVEQLQYLAFYDIQYKIGKETKIKTEPILILIN